MSRVPACIIAASMAGGAVLAWCDRSGPLWLRWAERSTYVVLAGLALWLAL